MRIIHYTALFRDALNKMLFTYFTDDLHKDWTEEIACKIGDLMISQYEQGIIDILLPLENEIPIGFAVYQVDSPKSDWCKRPGLGFIREFYIDRKHRSTGKGRILAAHTEQLLREKQVEQAYLTTAGALDFWISCGYSAEPAKENETLLTLTKHFPMINSKEQAALQNIAGQMAPIPGHTGFYYKNLITGYEFGVRDEEVFGAASVIKLPLFLHILSEAHAGRMSMEEKLLVTEEDKVPICGALTLFTGSIEADVRTLCRLMISISDNTATNRLIRHAELERASAGFRAMGLVKTQLKRFLFDQKASQAGLQNLICPREIGQLLEQLYRGTFVSPEVCKEALDVLLLQQVDHKLNGKICDAVPIAHKTGEDDQLSNDVGIVYARQPFVICFAGHDTDVYQWEDLMRRGTYELYQAFEE